MKLSPKYTIDDWNAAFATEPDWKRAIDIVQDRIEGRFIRWIDSMLHKEFAGFAIIALDCLLLETLHGFLTGTSTRDTRKVYKTMLMALPFGFDEALAVAFYENVRCGILHDTETRKGWTVRMTPQQRIVEQDAAGFHVVNRTMFHQAIIAAFEKWIKSLHAGDTAARDSMRRRMNEIIKVSI